MQNEIGTLGTLGTFKLLVKLKMLTWITHTILYNMIFFILSIFRMITFGQHFSIILATQQHKNTHQPEHQQDQPNQHDISPGNANVLLGG